MIEATPEAAIGKCQRLSASEEEIIIIWDSKLLLVDDQKGCIFDNFVLGSSWYQCETKAARTSKWAYPMFSWSLEHFSMPTHNTPEWPQPSRFERRGRRRVERDLWRSLLAILLLQLEEKFLQTQNQEIDP
jgi:hypothetical protein